MSDFVHNLVLRAAGLAAGVSARPPFQPGFAPNLPTMRWPAAPPRATGLLPTSGAAWPAEVPAAQPRQPERLMVAAAPANDREVVTPPWQDVEPAARLAPAPLPTAEDTGSQPPALRHSHASPPPAMPAVPASPRQVHREEAEPLASGQAAPQRPPQSTSISPPDAHWSPELVREGRPAPEKGEALPIGESLTTTAPDGALENRMEQPRRPATLNAVKTPAPRPQHTISPEEPHVPAARERTVVEPGAPLRAEPTPVPAVESLPPRTSTTPPLPLVRPASAPPPPRLVTAPLASPALAAEAAPAVQVRIGTVEVRASRPAPPAPHRPRPQPTGFDDYAHLRGLGWE